MNQKEYESVKHNYRLPSGELFPLPVVFDFDAATRDQIEKNDGRITLQDWQNNKIADLTVTDIWRPNKDEEG